MYMDIDMRPRSDMSFGLNMSLRSDLYVLGVEHGAEVGLIVGQWT